MVRENNFWLTKTLEQMNSDEWESLCDGCGICCLVKLENEGTGKIHTTSVSCQQLNLDTCRCRDYENRLEKVPMCTQLSAENISTMQWLPETCAYKRLHNGQALPDWHPLISANKHSVKEVGVSVHCFALSEEYIHPEQLIDFIID